MIGWKEVQEAYDYAIRAGAHGEYIHAIKYLDRCIETLTKLYKTETHYKMAIFYCKLGRALLRASMNPIPDEDLDDLSSMNKSSNSHTSTKSTDDDDDDDGDYKAGEDSDDTDEYSTTSSDELDPRIRAKLHGDATKLREPYDIVMSYFNKAVICINNAPPFRRTSRSVLVVEAEVYQSMGEASVDFQKPGVEEYITKALSLAITLYGPETSEVCACRYFLGYSYFQAGDFDKAIHELSFCQKTLARLEAEYRGYIRSLIKIEYEHKFHYQARRRLMKLRAEKASYRKLLLLTKAQAQRVQGLYRICTLKAENFDPTIGALVDTRGLRCSQSLLGEISATTKNRAKGESESDGDEYLSWPARSLAPDFLSLAKTETRP